MMYGEREVIFIGRFEASFQELSEFLDQRLNRLTLDTWKRRPDSAPYPHLPMDIWRQEYGEEPTPFDDIEGFITSKMGGPRVGHIFLHVYWLDKLYRTDGWIHMIEDARADFFFVGEIVLTPANPRNDKPTDVVITSAWPPMRPYWEWAVRRLRRNFRLRRKGGPRSTPLGRKLEVVRGWYAVEGTILKEVYCSNQGISTSGFRKWQKELKDKGIYSKG